MVNNMKLHDQEIEVEKNSQKPLCRWHGSLRDGPAGRWSTLDSGPCDVDICVVILVRPRCLSIKRNVQGTRMCRETRWVLVSGKRHLVTTLIR